MLLCCMVGVVVMLGMEYARVFVLVMDGICQGLCACQAWSQAEEGLVSEEALAGDAEHQEGGRLRGSRERVEGLEFMVQSSGFRVQVYLRVWGLF